MLFTVPGMYLKNIPTTARFQAAEFVARMAFCFSFLPTEVVRVVVVVVVVVVVILQDGENRA